jgi:hypothetical protein
MNDQVCVKAPELTAPLKIGLQNQASTRVSTRHAWGRAPRESIFITIGEQGKAHVNFRWSRL